MKIIAGIALVLGLMVVAPAQAEEQEPLPVSSPVGEVVEQKSEGSAFTGLIEIVDSGFPTEGFRTELPTLRIGVPEPTELVPSVFDGVTPVLGCDYYNPIQINYTWLSRSDGFAATVEQLLSKEALFLHLLGLVKKALTVAGRCT